MKQYAPEKLVAISRYQKLFPALSKEIQQEVYARILDGIAMSLLFNAAVGMGFLLWPQAYSTMFPRKSCLF